MSDAPPRDDRLDSWKEIAAYLKRDMTTVQRWERREGMPVHRHLHGKLGSVYAFRSELDEWVRTRSPHVASELEAASPRPAAPASAAPGRLQRLMPVGTLAAALLLAIAVTAWWRQREQWVNPIADATLQRITAFEGTERAAAVSRDGKFVAFLSNRDGSPDVWVTQPGTGNAYNLTRGAFANLVNDAVRNIGFSPDGALVTFWVRKPGESGEIGVWAVPTLGGEARPYLEGVAEFDWSSDASRLVYHTPAPGDPMLVRDPGHRAERQIFAAPPGVHAHFPLWSPDQSFIYFVQGSVPDAMDLWRIRPGGGVPERLTHHNSRVTHPVMLDARTLLYLAADPDGGGPWLHGLDVERRVPHRLSSGVERYTSLAASADGRQLVATLASSRETLWRLPLPIAASQGVTPVRVALTTGRAFSPRLGPGFLVYGSSKSDGDTIWKLADGTGTELWSEPGARIVGGPAIAPGGDRVAFAVALGGKTRLYAMNADGTKARVVTDSLEPRGAPAWAPDGGSIVVAENDSGVPRLFTVPLEGGSPVRLGREHSVDPAWSPDGRFIVYSGADIGTSFPVRAMRPNGDPFEFPNVVLTRGARRLRFLPGQQALVVLRGNLQHRNLWVIDLRSGSERQLTALGPDFDLRDFDISPDGREAVLQRVQEQSDVVLLDLPGR